jgi:hypothetical protein
MSSAAITDMGEAIATGDPYSLACVEGGSANFAFTEFYEVRYPQATPNIRHLADAAANRVLRRDSCQPFLTREPDVSSARG